MNLPHQAPGVNRANRLATGAHASVKPAFLGALAATLVPTAISAISSLMR
jgi:hypothetical protein